MSFPSYKKIAINSNQKRLIYTQLDQLDFGRHPYIFEMGHMLDQPEQAIILIESYFEEHQINIYAYPIVILGHAPEYNGDLLIIDDISKCPKFFKKRKKQLSTKESQKLKVVELKQKQFESLQLSEFEPQINEYARAHKVISQLHLENEYLKSILGGLKHE